jgi:hypothetical protein
MPKKFVEDRSVIAEAAEEIEGVKQIGGSKKVEKSPVKSKKKSGEYRDESKQSSIRYEFIFIRIGVAT